MNTELRRMGRSELAAIARLEVLEHGTRVDWGTAFLIGPRHAMTALHVVAKRGPIPAHKGDQLRLSFLNAGTTIERVVCLAEPHFNNELDWALLEFDDAEDDLREIEPLLLRALAPSNAAPFQSFGYARTNPLDGIAFSGHVENAAAQCEGAHAMQLFSVQAAANATRIAGLSGAPVFAGTEVVGIIRTFITEDGTSAAGTLYAVPIDAALKDAHVRNLARTDPCAGVPRLPDDLPLPPEPFRYLEAFGHDDAALFFGRCRELNDIITALDGETRILLLHGQSGVGKSSLIAAGLAPRLSLAYEVRVVRRSRDAGLTGALETSLGLAGVTVAELESHWRATEEASDKPLLIVLDQVEEVFTRPRTTQNDPGRTELDELLARVHAHYAVTSSTTRFVLSFRKEWLTEIDQALSRWGLGARSISVGPIDATAIEEIVLSIPRTPRLADRYQLDVDPRVAHRIALDLTRDMGSAIAPALRVVLTNLWKDARARDRGHPVFDMKLYERLAERGLDLERFVDERLAALPSELQEDVASGLALDVLDFHTTSLATAEQRTAMDLGSTYVDKVDRTQRLVAALVDVYLLVDVNAGTSGRGSTRLAHDMIAPIIRAKLATSQLPGSRARRILGASVEEATTPSRTQLTFRDLALVEAGLRGMRSLTPSETALIARSRSGRRIRAFKMWGLAIAAIAVVAGALVARAVMADEKQRRVVAEASTRRYEIAGACGCAIARIEKPLGVSTVTIEQVRDGSTTEVREYADKVYPDTKTDFEVRWLADGEALLPPGHYVVSYELDEVEVRMLVKSKGLGKDMTIELAPPETRAGYQFIGAGACGASDALVEPFMLALSDHEVQLDWEAARKASHVAMARLPTEHELICAARLGYLPQDEEIEDSSPWRWTHRLEKARAREEKASARIVATYRSVLGAADGLASSRFVRPLVKAGSDGIEIVGVGEQYDIGTFSHGYREELHYAMSDKFGSLLVLARDSIATYLVLRGSSCRTTIVKDALVAEGVATDRIAIQPPTEDDQDVVVATLTSTKPNVAPSEVATRPCRRIVTSTDIEVLDTITFDPGTSRIRASSFPIIKAVAATLAGNPTIRLMEVQAHVFDAPPSARLSLSRKRATMVRDLLVEQGVEPDRLEAEGYGDTQPLSCTPELAALVRKRLPIADMRRSDAWSRLAESLYLVSDLEEECKAPELAKQTRFVFSILKRQ